MDWERLQRRLAREWHEYLSDLRALRESLRSVEGWVTLALVLAVILMLTVWFITILGFDRLNMAISALGQSHGRICKPVGNITALVMIIDAVLLVFLAVYALGEMMRLLDRVRKGRPRQPFLVAVPSVWMLIVGTAGIIFMRIIC